MTSKEKVIHNRASTKKEDARVTRGKRDLALALQDLLRTKNFDDITIKEISQTAMVSKLTFYNNFLDKSDLLMFLFHKYSEEVYETLKKILESNCSLKEKYEKCVKAVIEYMHTIPFPINKVIKNDTSKVIYWNLTKFIEEACVKVAHLYGNLLGLNVPANILSYYYAGSFTNLIYHLAQEENRPDEETITKYILILTNLKDLPENN